MEYGTERWNEKWNGTVNIHSYSEHTQLQLTRVAVAAQSSLNYLVYL